MKLNAVKTQDDIDFLSDMSTCENLMWRKYNRELLSYNIGKIYPSQRGGFL